MVDQRRIFLKKSIKLEGLDHFQSLVRPSTFPWFPRANSFPWYGFIHAWLFAVLKIYAPPPSSPSRYYIRSITLRKRTCDIENTYLQFSSKTMCRSGCAPLSHVSQLVLLLFLFALVVHGICHRYWQSNPSPKHFPRKISNSLVHPVSGLYPVIVRYCKFVGRWNPTNAKIVPSCHVVVRALEY